MAPATRSQLRLARRLLLRKERERRGEFLAEGPQAVREALASPGWVLRLFATAAAADRHRDLIDSAASSGVASSLVTDDELAGVSDTRTPQGLLAVCHRAPIELDAVWRRRPRLVVCCAAVRDPGNAGTVIRCADAFGAEAVVLTTGSVDPTNPKTVRASVGSLFHLPVVTEVELPAVVASARTAGLQVLAAAGGGTYVLPDLAARGELGRPSLWVFGNEAWGLPEADLALVDRVVAIPIYGAAESLNLSTAAAVCLYATATAQRGSTGFHRSNALAPASDPFLH